MRYWLVMGSLFRGPYDAPGAKGERYARFHGFRLNDAFVHEGIWCYESDTPRTAAGVPNPDWCEITERRALAIIEQFRSFEEQGK